MILMMSMTMMMMTMVVMMMMMMMMMTMMMTLVVMMMMIISTLNPDVIMSPLNHNTTTNKANQVKDTFPLVSNHMHYPLSYPGHFCHSFSYRDVFC